MFFRNSRHLTTDEATADARKPPEEPDQPRLSLARPCRLSSTEKIRLLVISASLLTLLAGFLFFLATHTVVLLFLCICFTFVTYRWLDRFFGNSVQPQTRTSSFPSPEPPQQSAMKAN
jgi:hypothetical protein